MKKDPFDIFKDGLSEYEPAEIPAWLSWEENATAIQTGLSTHGKKRRKPFWLFLLLALGLFGAGSWYYLSLAGEPNVSNSESEANASQSHISSHKEGRSTREKEKPSAKPEEEVPLFPSSQTVEEKIVLSQDEEIASEAFEPTQIQSAMEENFTGPLIQSIETDPLYLLLPEEINLPDSLQSQPQIPATKAQIWFFSLSGGVNTFLPGYQSSLLSRAPSEVEEELLGWSAALRISKSLGPGISVHSGLEADRLRYIFQLDEEADVMLFRPNTPDSIFINRLRRDTSIVFTDSIPGTRSIIARQYNSHFRLAIPILIGYSFPGTKWNHSLKFGPQVQLFRHSRGYTSVEEAELLRINQESSRNKGLILGFQTEWETAYEIIPGWMLLTQLGIHKSLGNWTYKQVPELSQRPLILYGRIGIGKRF